MRRLAPLFAFLCVLSWLNPAWAAHVVFNLADFATGTLTNKTLNITPLSSPRPNGSLVITSDRKSYISDYTGSVTASNMVYGNYQCDFKGPIIITTFTILVPDSNATLNANSLITSTVGVPANSTYTAATSDVRYEYKATNTPGTTAYVLTTDGTNNYWAAAAGGGIGSTNANQFGASVTLTIKSGALTTNLQTFGHTNTGNFSNSGPAYIGGSGGGGTAQTLGGNLEITTSSPNLLDSSGNSRLGWDSLGTYADGTNNNPSSMFWSDGSGYGILGLYDQNSGTYRKLAYQSNGFTRIALDVPFAMASDVTAYGNIRGNSNQYLNGTAANNGMTVTGSVSTVTTANGPSGALFLQSSNGTGGIVLTPQHNLPVVVTNIFQGSNFAPGQVLTVVSSNNNAITWAASNAPTSGVNLYQAYDWNIGSGRNYDSANPAFSAIEGLYGTSSDGVSIRTPMPIDGTLTNLVLNVLHSSVAIGTGTNMGVIILTNGVASSLAGNFVGDGSTTVLYITNVGLAVKRGVMVSAKYTNSQPTSQNLQVFGGMQLTSP